MYYDCKLNNKRTLELRLLLSLSYYQYPVSLLNFLKVYHKTSKCLKQKLVLLSAPFSSMILLGHEAFSTKKNYNFENNEKKVRITN